MALQTKVYTQTSNTFTLELTLTENSTSVSGNSSSVSYTLKLKSTTKDFYQYRVGASVSLDGKTVATRDRYTAAQIGIGTYSSVTLLSGTATVGHGADGTKSMALSYSLDMASASYTPGPVSGSGTMALTSIPRGATITSAPNFTDEDSPTVKYSNPAGGSLQVGIYKTDGSTALAGYRTATGSSYTFRFTAAEKANLQKVNTGGNTATVRFYLKSVVGGQTFIKSVERTLTIADPKPTLNPTVTDSNNVTYALTGDRSKLVKYHSNAKVTFGASAVKGATLKSKKVTCATQALTADGTMQGVESGTFSFSATDSRGNTTAKTVTKDMVNYVRLSCNLGDGVPDGEGTFALEVTGACFYGSFGAVDNALTVEYRYRVQGEETWEEWTAVDSVLPLGFTYLARARVEGLDYQATYQFQARATDKLETVTTPEKTVKSLPTFDWSGTDFNFNVPVTVQGHNVVGCGCTAYMNTNMTGISTNVTVPMTVLASSYGGMNLSNGAVYIPEEGLYLISGQIMVASGANGRYLGLQVNGSKGGFILDSYIGFSKDYGVIASVPTLAKLQAGELVTLIARMSDATSGAMISGSSRTKLTIVKMH